MFGYIIVGVACFVIGFAVAAILVGISAVNSQNKPEPECPL